MDGFKDTTRMKMGHAFSSSPACPSYAKGSRNVFATGGIVAPYKTPGRAAPSAPRPVLPRPHVMPQMKSAHMPRTVAKLARGGKVMNGVSDGGGGPYNGNQQGNSLEKANRPYSQIEVEHPRNDARPGYSKGGKKSGINIKPSHEGLFTKKMTGSKSGKLTGADVSKGLHSGSPSTRKQANFARMARRGFKPLCEGGKVGYAKGGAVECQKIADREISKHVAAPRPSGHGVRSGNLAFMSKPLFGK